ncbi:MAG: bifunctional tRNA (5-methylaminomethyl-2-thiouridine)(34)-methyltransferase MnmD/FAD-dependent 5-carboxymethylaminomethyl-2-thiouridine(34) oxidoreductase MnmC [Nitrosomonadales bacterium]|nr:bifunctional tRNA (5-methylaminomethyl-2-thiouridine)(34)-methyltransferase MnmD/FAD-dependent 5-carboxymethylaminomethyl-2-thiouridine(34) oxidoreductase MnmC [Nitrosomonadales bacterium]
MTLDWKDGQPFSTRFDDVYFSTDSGLEETRHVFLHGNRLPERFAALSAGDSFAIGETGFGTGLNFLCASQLFQQVAASGATLDFFSTEKFPLSDEELRASLELWPELGELAGALLACWRRRVPGWNRWSFCGGRVRLTLVLADVAEALSELAMGSVDAWFLDGFAPSRNPEMWAQPVLAQLTRTSRPGATFATYTSAGWVRRGLAEAGFRVERVPGYGRKREMARGELLRLADDVRPSRRPRTALVVGAGLAGCAAAHALAQRGIGVTLVDRAASLASGASGNPRGILHARFAAGMNPLHRFVLAAYGHALALLDEVLPVDGVARAECGLLQLEFSENEAKRIGKLASLDWPPHLLQILDAAAASQQTGLALEQGGLWFPAGGWVVPPQVCARLASAAVQRLQHEVVAISRADHGWRVTGSNAQGVVWVEEADIVVVCNGHQARTLASFANFPLTPVRGQITELPATPRSSAIQPILCAEGYCAPAQDGRHVAGATHAFDDESLEVRPADHAENLAKLAEHISSLSRALGEPAIDALTGRASVRCSAPGATPLVGEVSPGLFCSLAHGTRGLLTAGLSAELIAAAACGQLQPVPNSVLAALSPAKRVRG